HGIDGVKPTDACVRARARRVDDLLGETPIFAGFLVLLFAGELLVLVVALHRRRHARRSPRPLRAELVRPAIGLALVGLAFVLGGALSTSAINVLDPDDGAVTTALAFLTTWVWILVRRIAAARRHQRSWGLLLAQVGATAVALVITLATLYIVLLGPLGVVTEDAQPALLTFYLALIALVAIEVAGLTRTSEWWSEGPHVDADKPPAKSP
ncbi:MAG: hypothetical protein R3B09_33335, partial [Nannocystaceae bacterium]